MPSPRDMIDDKPDENLFRVHRAAFTDPEIFDREMAQIFDRTWLYIGHESQLPNHGDYLATRLGRHPVFAMR
ncbi:MAG: benzoate 1,2-dioxygenase large subunit, partial [Alphaproteobacteria bacterium]|nr:benzoate 1,2-dioxygenase large subunit [Alphaproteobacteria bacterium]